MRLFYIMMLTMSVFVSYGQQTTQTQTKFYKVEVVKTSTCSVQEVLIPTADPDSVRVVKDLRCITNTVKNSPTYTNRAGQTYQIFYDQSVERFFIIMHVDHAYVKRGIFIPTSVAMMWLK